MIDRVHRKIYLLQDQVKAVNAAYDHMLTAADSFKVFALTLSSEIKEETEQLELYIRIGRNYGVFNTTSNVCPCALENICRFANFLGEWYINWVINSNPAR